MAMFVAEHNLPFTVMDHLPKLLKKICPDSDIAKQIACSRTKTSVFFRLRCLDFYIESVDKVLKRIPFQEPALRYLELLDPTVSMTGKAASLAPLFWAVVFTQKHCDGSAAFPALTEFVIAILCLPHSSAAVERVFSAVNNLKTKLRNKLSTETICGLLHTKRLMTSSACHSFNIDKPLIRRMDDSHKDNRLGAVDF
ncbi:uncharacterized protein LOC142566774 [Dermacentor variabilis]|uniref:uncharacterized protein LOC142566774 n=1 Tax=Dermacentor variabilis TaxID=34621 RepID=UPI003F5B81CF